MKKGILLLPMGNENWMGGVYYMKNIAFQLSVNEQIKKYYNIYVVVREKNRTEFDDLSDSVKILVEPQISYSIFLRFWKLMICIKHNISCIYPTNSGLLLPGIKTISWIPDFQHKHLAYMFSSDDIMKRDIENEKIAKANHPLILSSYDALNDFRLYYNPFPSRVSVMHFVSYIEPQVRLITPSFEKEVKTKFDIGGKYACVMNQFWQHKNHIIVLKAIKLLHKQLSGFVFVFTGSPKDYRNPDYYGSLMTLMEDSDVKPHIRVLGFIDRLEQIAIMKNSELVIQPSFFEGWGTVVEDAKVLDKTILLSDIPVHREQMNNKCILFNPIKDEDLAEKISSEIKKEHHSDIEKGLVDMRIRAKEYSKSFEKLLCNKEKS